MNTRQLYSIKSTSKSIKYYFLILFLLFSSACLDTSDITTPPKSEKDAAKSYALNKQSPDFEITLLNEKQFKLSEHKGEIILLNFWASYCKPCQWEMPAFEKIWLKYQNQNILIVGIALSDTKTNIDKFLSLLTIFQLRFFRIKDQSMYPFLKNNQLVIVNTSKYTKKNIKNK